MKILDNLGGITREVEGKNLRMRGILRQREGNKRVRMKMRFSDKRDISISYIFNL